MKKILLLTVSLILSNILLAQKEVVFNKIADNICSCLVAKGVKATSPNLEKEIETCFTEAIVTDLTDLMSIYTMDELSQRGEEIGEEIGLIVIQNCPYLYGGEKVTATKKSTLDPNIPAIETLSKITCDCVSELNKSTEIDVDKAVEKCINAAMKKKKAKKALKKTFKTVDFDNETLLNIQNAVFENLENTCGDFVLLKKKEQPKASETTNQKYTKVSEETCKCLDDLNVDESNLEQLNTKVENCLGTAIVQNMSLFLPKNNDEKDYQKMMEEVGVAIGIELVQICPNFLKYIQLIEKEEKKEKGERG